MFWRTEDGNKTSALTTVLDKPDVTITEVLDDDYVLQEIKYGNKRLIEFFTKPENLVSLITLCITEPTSNENESKKYRYCHLASEIFNANAQELVAALANSEECLRILSSFVANGSSGGSLPTPLNPLLASFFAKIVNLLVFKHLDRVLSYMQSDQSFLKNLLSNIEVSALMDCLFRLAYGNDNEEQTMEMKSWLAEQGFVSKLVSLFDDSCSEESHQNASYLLCELTRCLRDVQYGRAEKASDPLLERLQSPAILDDLLDRILGDKTCWGRTSIISNGCSVFIMLLQSVFIPNNPLDAVNNLGNSDRESTVRGHSRCNGPASIGEDTEIWTPDPDHVVEKCLLDRLDDFKKLLMDGENTEPSESPVVFVQAPFGAARLALVKLLVQLLTNGAPQIHCEFARLDLMNYFLDSFFKYKNNNFLHTCVVNAVICSLFSRLPWAVDSPSENMSVDEIQDSTEPCENHVDEVRPIGLGQWKHTECRFPSPLLKQLIGSQHILKLLATACTEYLASWPGTNAPAYSGHLMRIAVCTHLAMDQGPHRDTMQEQFKDLPEDERIGWTTFVQEHLLSYIKRNEPDQVGTLACGDVDIGGDKAEDFGQKMAAAFEQAALAFAEFNSRRINEIPEEFGFAADTFTVDPDESPIQLMAKAADINFQLGPIPEPNGEIAFEAACAKKIILYGANDEQADDNEQAKNVEWIDKEPDSVAQVGSGEPSG